MCTLFGSWPAASAPHLGEVTGSRVPESSSVGVSTLTGSP
jgi:hypothetical protein